MKRRETGFTLIEILVVVSILGVLMGLVSVLVLRASARQREEMTKQLVKTILPTKIKRYEQEFNGRPVPCTLQELNKVSRWKPIAFGDGNAVNESAEVLLVALRHPDLSAPFAEDDLPGDTKLGNLDGDVFNQTPDGSDGVEAMEILDAYGSVVVFISKNHYGKVFKVINGMGEEVNVEAVKKADGNWYNKTSFQIISLGENGVQDLEGGDDIVNFTREGE